MLPFDKQEETTCYNNFNKTDHDTIKISTPNPQLTDFDTRGTYPSLLHRLRPGLGSCLLYNRLALQRWRAVEGGCF